VVSQGAEREPNYFCSSFGSAASLKGLSSCNYFLQQWDNNTIAWNTKYGKKESTSPLTTSGESHPCLNNFHIPM